MPKSASKRSGRKTKSPDLEREAAKLLRTQKWLMSSPEKREASTKNYIRWSKYFHHWRGFIDGLMQLGLTNDAVVRQVQRSLHDETDPPYVVSLEEARTYLNAIMKEWNGKEWRWRQHYEILLEVLGG